MSEPVAPAPQQPQQSAPQYAQPTRKPLSAMAVTALVLGSIGLVFCWIPVINNVAIILAVLGAVFGIIGLLGTRKNGKKRGFALSVAGLIASVLAIVFALVMQAAWGAALDSASDSLEKATDGKTTASSVVLEATASTKGSAMYGPLLEGSTSTKEFTKSWKQEYKGDDAKKVYSVTVTNSDYEASDDSVKVSCKITVDGKVVAQQEATGQAGAATCTMKDN